MIIGQAYPKAVDYIFQACTGKKQRNTNETLNNINLYRTLGIGEKKLVITYVATANTNIIIITITMIIVYISLETH